MFTILKYPILPNLELSNFGNWLNFSHVESFLIACDIDTALHDHVMYMIWYDIWYHIV